MRVWGIIRPPHTDADVSGDGHDGDFVGLPVGGPKDSVLALALNFFKLVNDVTDGHGPTDTVRHILINLFGPRAAAKTDNGPCQTVALVNGDAVHNTDDIVGVMIDQQIRP